MAVPATWILLRGLGRESGHWAPFSAQFQARFPQATLRTPDLPGTGRARRMNGPWSVRGIAEHLQDQMEGAAPAPWGIIGHSLGGMVALEWAAWQPALVRHVVTLNTSTTSKSAARQRLQPAAIKSLLEILTVASDREREEKILRLVSRIPGEHTDILSTWVQISKERRPSRANVLRQLWAAHRFTMPRFAEPRSEILCLASMGDGMVDPGCTAALANALKAQAHFHPWAGHELTLDDPTWVLDRVQEWLTPARPK